MSIALLWIVALVAVAMSFAERPRTRIILGVALLLLLIVASYPNFKRGLKEIKSDLPQIGVVDRSGHTFLSPILPTEFHEAMDTLRNITKP